MSAFQRRRRGLLSLPDLHRDSENWEQLTLRSAIGMRAERPWHYVARDAMKLEGSV
jgi:hypothetical protein